MNTDNKITLSMSFWIITIVMLIWSVMGSVNLFWQLSMSADVLASFPETHRAIIIDRPLWATAGFAVGVLGGALGCILLMLKKSAARIVFIASLLGIIVTMVHTINVASSVIGFTPIEIFMMIVLPVLVAAFLIWYASIADNKGWLYRG